jgi:hypothetical protein
MNFRARSITQGLIWVVFSPIAVLMALISTVESITTYYIQVAAFGLWSCLGVLSGFATMGSAAWARRIQTILLWIAVAYFGLCGILMFGYLLSALLNQGAAAPAQAWAIALGVLLTGAPFLYFAKKRSVEKDRTESKRQSGSG